jgi:chloramphenicol-sensitive protein RarD
VGENRQAAGRGGLAYGLAAYGLWGVIPLYFWALRSVPPAEFLAHRIVWCLLFLAVVLTLVGRWPDVFRALRSPRTRRLLTISACLVAVNWLVYIYSVATERVLHSSLGYFINPLFNVLLGLVFFRERLRPAQWLAVALAGAGLAYLVWAAGELPWIAPALAVSFGLYGLVRKVTPVDGLTGLAVETLVLTPPAAAYLLWWAAAGSSSFGRYGWHFDALLMLSGVLTALPLLCFGQAARRLRLSTLGFLQYLAPSIQFLLAVFLFGEPFRPEQQVGFGCTWAALLIFTADSLLAQRRQTLREREPEVPQPRDEEREIRAPGQTSCASRWYRHPS